MVNRGNNNEVKETIIDIYLTKTRERDLTKLLKEYINVFTWPSDGMPKQSTNIVLHKQPNYPEFNQKNRRLIFTLLRYT